MMLPVNDYSRFAEGVLDHTPWWALLLMFSLLALGFALSFYEVPVRWRTPVLILRRVLTVILGCAIAALCFSALTFLGFRGYW